MRALIPFLATLVATPMAMADTALILANSRYDVAQSLRNADDVARLEAPLAAQGFDVIVVENGTPEAMRAGVSALLEAEETGRVVIAVAGHLVRAQSDSWVLASDARDLDLGTVGGAGISLSVLMEVAARAPGRAVLLVAQERRRVSLGQGLTQGLGPLVPPQGVTVISGAADDLADFAESVLLVPGADLAAGVEAYRGLRASGFLSGQVPFLADTAAAAPPASPIVSSPEERALWVAAQELNNVGAYRAYVEQYPEGVFADEARARIAALEAQEVDPLVALEAAEAALGFDRDTRRDVQRYLTILGFDTRGVDGIFGRGTRSAVRAWQEANGFEPTGYLNGPQWNILRERGSVRAAQIEAEERRAEEARARADEAFWQATGFGRDEEGLRQYLDRYPNGRYAEEAQTRLDQIEAERRAQAEGEERRVWDEVRARDTVDAYRGYLDAYPDGLFADFAQERIAVLQGGSGMSQQEIAQAQAREAALNLPQVTRLLIERRLAGLGLATGAADGEFDRQTRSAIGNYQAARNLAATGYLDQMTMVRLLAEAFGGVLSD